MYFIKLLFIGLMSTFIISCSAFKKREEAAKASVSAPPAATPAPAPTPVPPAPVVETKKDDHSAKELEALKTSLKKAEEIVKKDPPHESHARKVGPIPSDKALGWLRNGNVRFVKGFLRKDGANKLDIERLSKGQAPHSIIVSCSDSRVPPEVIFDQKLGEIFVVRTAGQSIDDSVLASIEYAVEHLGTNLILVMGHTSCGAVKASFETAVGGDTGSPYINALVAEIQPRIAARMKGPASELLIAEGWDNTRGVAQKLLEKSKIVREAAKSGSLRVESALYHLKSGQVEWNK